MYGAFQETQELRQPEMEESETVQAETEELVDQISEHSDDIITEPEGDGPLQDLIQSLEASKSQLRPLEERRSVKAENFWQDKSQKEAQSPERYSPMPAEVNLLFIL